MTARQTAAGRVSRWLLMTLVAVCASSSDLAAQTALERVRARGTLRIGMDATQRDQ